MLWARASSFHLRRLDGGPGPFVALRFPVAVRLSRWEPSLGAIRGSQAALAAAMGRGYLAGDGSVVAPGWHTWCPAKQGRRPWLSTPTSMYGRLPALSTRLLPEGGT